MFNCLPLLLVVIVVPLYAASTVPMSMTYSMEKEPSFQSICGRNVLMPVNGYQHKLISRYGHAGGICFATLMLGGTSKSRCKICVHLEGGRHLILHKDIMNITFTSGTENVLLKYGHAIFNDTCFHGRRLDILVADDEEYVKKPSDGKKSRYSFNFALTPECSEEPEPITTIPNNASSTTMTMTSSKTNRDISDISDIKTLSIVIVILVVLTIFFQLARIVDFCTPSRKILNWRHSRRENDLLFLNH